MKARVRIWKCFVWSKLLYGCEAWTNRKDLRRKFDASEMWFTRRMLKPNLTRRKNVALRKVEPISTFHC